MNTTLEEPNFGFALKKRQTCRSTTDSALVDQRNDGEMDWEEKINELLPTRESLLSRLRDVSEEGSWREFFELYWKLIYNTARRASLSNTEAEEVVQETMISLA